MGVKLVKPALVKDVLGLLNISLDTLRSVGPSIIGGDPAQWNMVGLDTAIPLPTLAVLLVAGELAPILSQIDKIGLLETVIKTFQDPFTSIPEVVKAQLNGGDVNPVVLNLIDNFLIEVSDAGGASKIYSLTDEKEITAKDMKRWGPPVRSYAIVLSTLFMRLFHFLYEMETPVEQIREAQQTIATAPAPSA